MRKIDKIVLHCTATPQTATIEAIQRYWREELGWRGQGYHYIIEPNGRVTQLTSDERITNGVLGHNSNTLHIAYIGGQFRDDRTIRQRQAMYMLATLKRMQYKAEVVGHRDFESANRDCPQFDASEWIRRHPLSLTT